MSKPDFVIITDSSCDLPAGIVEQLELHVIPLTYTIGDRSYLNYSDHREMPVAEVYNQLRAKQVITTNAVNMADIEDAMLPYLEQGMDVLYLSFSSALSCSYSVARNVGLELGERFTERRIIVIDTLSASLGQGMLVWLACKRRLEGQTLDEVVDFVEGNKLNLCHWFTVDDLFFLKRGGRVSAALAIVGSVLGIKPILHTDNNGCLVNVGRAHGRKNALLELLERMKQTIISPEEQTVFISHGDCLEDAEFLAAEMKEQLHVEDVIINHVGPVIGAHAGPGVLAIFFLGTER